MKIFADFVNKSASVIVNVWDADTDVKVVNTGNCTLVNGLYRFDFWAREATKDYYLVFTNVTNNITVSGIIPRDPVTNAGIRAEIESTGGKLHETLKVVKKMLIQLY